MNLDTKKSAKEKEVLEEVKNILKKEEERVFAKFICNRYSSSKDTVNFKFPITQEDIVGYSDVFSIFGIEVSKEEWENFFSFLGNYILETLKE